MAIDLEQIQDSPHLLEILIQMEDVLDSLDVYVFKNWFAGEIVDGPRVRRHWLEFTLQYDYLKMPDPRAAIRLLKHGVRVDYQKVRFENDEPVYANENGKFSAISGLEIGSQTEDGEEADEENMAWHVRISMPRRLVQITADELDFYDEEVEAEDVQAAKDSGLDDEETGYTEEGNDELNSETPPEAGEQAQGNPEQQEKPNA